MDFLVRGGRIVDIKKIQDYQAVYFNNGLIFFRPKSELEDVYNGPVVHKIADNTQNTWQKDRKYQEILDNTVQGKIVEDMFKNFIDAHSRGIAYLSYDTFRSDVFKKHAPFDGFLFKEGNIYVDEAIERVNNDVEHNEFGKVSDNTFDWLTKMSVFTVEIKSSKIPDKDYPKEEMPFTKPAYQQTIIDNLRKRDYFLYPKYGRSEGKSIHSFSDYVNYVGKKTSNKGEDFISQLLAGEIKGHCDIYTRVFVDRNHSDSFIAYMLGYTLKTRFFENPEIINMPGGKSGDAVYFAYPIALSRGLNQLFIDGELWGNGKKVNAETEIDNSIDQITRDFPAVAEDPIDYKIEK